MGSEMLKYNFSVVLCIILIGLLFFLGKFYFQPLYEEAITIENALYEKWAGFSIVVLLVLVCPKHFRFALSAMLVACVLNATALAVNDGYMPVTSSSCIYVEGNHIPMHEGARLPILCDWIFGYMSIGDIFLVLGSLFTIIAIWRYRRSVEWLTPTHTE